MDLNLRNKTALVCGSSKGLGLASAHELALLGANVILASRSESKLAAAVEELDTSAGQKHSYAVIDLADPEAAKAVATELLLAHTTIHILVNNAGGPASGALIDTVPDALEAGFKTHLMSSHLLAQLLVPGMKEAGFGRIVNILSTAVKQPIDGLGISNAIRAGVANWAKTLANELGCFGITVNNVLPGYTNTARLDYLFEKQADEQQVTKQTITSRSMQSIPAKRLGEPHELGAAVAFLCSPAAAYINGINLPVDGGKTASL